METVKINLNEIVIKPIITEEDFQEANGIIDVLVDADLLEDPVARKRASEILGAITLLAIDYEKKHYPITKLDPIEAIKYRMEMLNLSQKELAKLLGGENRVSEVLNRKRPLTLRMIKKLYHELGISAETLLAY